MLVLDERHQVHVLLPTDNEDALASITVGVRMLQDVEQVAPLDLLDVLLGKGRQPIRHLRLLGVSCTTTRLDPLGELST